MNLFVNWYKVPSKTQPVQLWSQYSHVRRFQTTYDLNHCVSPFVYGEQANFVRILGTEQQHKALEKTGEFQIATEPVELLTFRKFITKSEKELPAYLFNPKFNVLLTTPLAIRYTDARVHYRVFNSLYDILLNMRQKAKNLKIFDGIPAKVFSNRTGYLLHNLQPAVGSTVSVITSYARAQKVVTGMVGYISYDTDYLYENEEGVKEVLSYFRYLMGFISFGYRSLAIAFPYRADLCVEELKPFGNYAISMHPIEEYPVLYKI